MSSTSNTTGQAAQTVKDAASHARAGVLDFGTQLLELFGRMRDAEGHGVERLLQRMGLQRREGLTQPVVFFAAGAVFGAGAGLLFAPTSGSELRRNLGTFFSGKVDEVTSRIKAVLEPKEKDVATESATKIDNGAHPYKR
ncbi:MAG: YtxH domain-containing protein [Polyangiaceae bacterium]|jgi:hypothetical protein